VNAPTPPPFPSLTPRWTPLRYHPVQAAYWNSPHRFNVVPAGRRSGKTETAKRKLIKKALRGGRFRTSRFFAAAPTYNQAKRIYWQDLKDMVPDHFKDGKPSESELIIYLVTGAEIHVLGMDSPERVEGQPWDGGVLDEFANMKPQAWTAHVRPALSDRLGWCDLIGVPEGRNHYYDVYRTAQQRMAEKGDRSDWGAFTWKSADILPASEVEAAKADLDPLTYQQEYEASFVNFEGRAYYAFDDRTNTERVFNNYDDRRPIGVCLDFNVEPGVAVVVQEMVFRDGLFGTGVVGEVHIPRNSNTPAVCRKILQDWGRHRGEVNVYGDATGGARGTAKVGGSDWDIVKRDLGAVFGNRMTMKVPPANPPERSRLNAVNSRLMTTGGLFRLRVDPVQAPNLVRDLEGVRLLAGGSGEIDKAADRRLSHISDALGYYVVKEFPVEVRRLTTSAV
jgi:hypothetical protein